MYLSRNFLTLILVLIFGTLNLTAQDERLDDFDFSFDSEPLNYDKAPYFVIGVGYLFDFYQADVDFLNDYLQTQSLGDKKFKTPLFLSGASGFTSLGFLPGAIFKNMRFGFYYVSGNSLLKETSTGDEGNLIKSNDYRISMNGFSLDYAIVPFRNFKFAIIPGATFGWGRLELESYQTKTEYEWGENPIENYYHDVKSSFLFGKAYLNLEYSLTNFALLQVQGSYRFTGSYDWKYNNSGKLNNVPSDFNSDGMTLRVGIFLGLFNY